MRLRDAYLSGSDILGTATAPIAVAVPAPNARDLAVAEAERVVAEEADEERRALVPFETGQVSVPAAPAERVLKSEIPNVSDKAWTRFVLAMKTAEPGAVSASNDLGMFGIKVRRLADLGLVLDVRQVRSPVGRLAWIGDFVPPLTQRKFLSSASEQYAAFVASMRRYIEGLVDGTLPRPEGGPAEGMTLSGALAVLHRCGPSGLRTWCDEDDRFPDTVALYERANGAF